MKIWVNGCGCCPIVDVIGMLWHCFNLKSTSCILFYLACWAQQWPASSLLSSVSRLGQTSMIKFWLTFVTFSSLLFHSFHVNPMNKFIFEWSLKFIYKFKTHLSKVKFKLPIRWRSLLFFIIDVTLDFYLEYRYPSSTHALTWFAGALIQVTSYSHLVDTGFFSRSQR